MQQSTICIRISRQQKEGEMFLNAIFIIFNNQHRHRNIVHRWMQSYKNMQQSATILAVHCSSEYNHITIPQPPIQYRTFTIENNAIGNMQIQLRDAVYDTYYTTINPNVSVTSTKNCQVRYQSQSDSVY